MKKVVKFGGSSLASAEQFKKVGYIIRQDDTRRYVVPSAPGKRFAGDTKVTDMLYSCYLLALREEEEQEDPRAELVQQLLEYKMYKCISYELKDRQVDAQKVMFKVPTVPPEVAAYEEPVDLDELVGDTTLAKLNDIFKSIMQKKQDRIDPVRSKFGRIEKEQVSLEDTMHTLEEYARTHRSFSFKNLLESKSGKMEIIVNFLAILELMKLGKISISQEHIFDDIRIESKVAA